MREGSGASITVTVDREKVVQAAQKLITKGRLDRAVVEYQKLVKANPGDDRAMLKIAELQTRMRAYDAAVSTYEQVAAYYASQGFSAKAMAIYKQIRGLIQQHLPESKGHYGPVVDKLASLYVEAGLKGDAVATYQEYVVHLKRVGRDGELLPVYRKIVELKDDDLEARLRLIEALREDGEQQEADDHLLAYGERLVSLGRIDEGLLALDNVALRRQSDAVLARRVADLYLDRNGPGDAMVAMQRMQVCFMSTQRDIDTLRVLARAFTLVGQRAKAVEVRKLMVKIAWDKGDAEIAQALVDELMEDCPGDESVLAIASTVYPDRVFAPPVPMPDDAPAVEAAPASVDLSEESFEMLEDSVIDLGEEALEAASSYPPPHAYEPEAFGAPPPPRPPAPPAPRAYAPRSNGSPPSGPRDSAFAPRPVGLPRPFETGPRPPRPVAPPARPSAPQPPPPRPSAPGRRAANPLPPPRAPFGSENYEPLPSPPPFPPTVTGPEHEGPGFSSLDAEYDAIMPDAEEPQEEETTLARRRADLIPGPIPESDIFDGTDEPFGGVDEGFGETSELGDGQLAAFAPPGIVAAGAGLRPAEPEYEVDDALEEALEEADFFASQGLYDDALSALEELIPRYPGHPLLIERMQSVRAAMRNEG